MKSTMITQLRDFENAINSMYALEEFVTSIQDHMAFAADMAQQIVHILTAPLFKEFIDDTLLSELRAVAQSVDAFARGGHISHCYLTVLHGTK